MKKSFIKQGTEDILLSTERNYSIKKSLFKSSQHLSNIFLFCLVFNFSVISKVMNHHFGNHQEISQYPGGPVRH